MQIEPKDSRKTITNNDADQNNASREKKELQEKTSAAAAPRKPKKGAVSSPLKVDMSKLAIWI